MVARSEAAAAGQQVREAAQALQRTGLDFHKAVTGFAVAYIQAALRLHRGNRCRAAIVLGMHRNTLARWMKGKLPPDPRGSRNGH